MEITNNEKCLNLMSSKSYPDNSCDLSNLKLDVEEKSSEEKQVSADEIRLDSENFDAKKALLSDFNVILPCPNAKTFNNLAEYFSKTFGKNKNDKQLLDAAKCEIPILSAKERFAKFIKPKLEDEPSSIQSVSKKKLSTVLSKMDDAEFKGPISLLHKSLNCRVKVFVRRRKHDNFGTARFAWLSGLLIVFDKHFNLVLSDVEESFKTLNQERQEVEVLNKTNKLFVRGACVLLVSFR